VGLARYGTGFPMSTVVGAAVPAAVCRWWLCPALSWCGEVSLGGNQSSPSSHAVALTLGLGPPSGESIGRLSGVGALWDYVPHVCCGGGGCAGDGVPLGAVPVLSWCREVYLGGKQSSSSPRAFELTLGLDPPKRASIDRLSGAGESAGNCLISWG